MLSDQTETWNGIMPPLWVGGARRPSTRVAVSWFIAVRALAGHGKHRWLELCFLDEKWIFFHGNPTECFQEECNGFANKQGWKVPSIRTYTYLLDLYRFRNCSMVIRVVEPFGDVFGAKWPKWFQWFPYVSLLLLLSRGTVDGRNPAPVDNSWYLYVVYLIIYKVLYIPDGAGFLPSTVFFHMNIVPSNLGEVGNHCHRLLDVAVREPVRMFFCCFFRSLWHSESRHRWVSWKNLWFAFF